MNTATLRFEMMQAPRCPNLFRVSTDRKLSKNGAALPKMQFLPFFQVALKTNDESEKQW